MYGEHANDKVDDLEILKQSTLGLVKPLAPLAAPVKGALEPHLGKAGDVVGTKTKELASSALDVTEVGIVKSVDAVAKTTSGTATMFKNFVNPPA